MSETSVAIATEGYKEDLERGEKMAEGGPPRDSTRQWRADHRETWRTKEVGPPKD